MKLPTFKSLPKAEAAPAPELSQEAKTTSGLLTGKTKLIAGTALAVFGIGFVMQNVLDHPAVSNDPTQNSAHQAPRGVKPALEVSNVVPTAANASLQTHDTAALQQTHTASLLPIPTSKPTPTNSDRVQALDGVPADTVTPTPLELKDPIQTAAYENDDVNLPSEESVPQLACALDLIATSAPAATVDLTLTAACLPNERMTLHHNGMMFTAVTDASGRLDLRVPALSENAVFIASFSNGEGAVAQIDVPTLEFYDRVVVQWRGDSGLGLHALEFGASYFAEGHIHAGAMGEVEATVKGATGFLMRFGQDAGPEALQAEIYTFPTGTASKAGDVGLSVEAEVTAENCGTEVAAQTLQIGTNHAMQTKDLDLFMPECDAVGDFLVLKNLLEDLKVASN